MSSPVHVYGPILHQSLSQYWSVLQMCVTFCEHQITKNDDSMSDFDSITN